MIVKRFGCTAIHNKALYKCFIHSFIQQIVKMNVYGSAFISAAQMQTIERKTTNSKFKNAFTNSKVR